MTKISVLYPNPKGARFDVRYYLDTHLHRYIERMQAAIHVPAKLSPYHGSSLITPSSQDP